ncbi:hypothetical protein N9A67_07120 [Rhodobacteraceae bacterium]|nr:hypothetical protein [Paracoccaceae bacterium]
MTLTLITLRITLLTLALFFVSGLAPFSHHDHWDRRYATSKILQNLDHTNLGLCNKINTFNFFVPLESSPRIAWVDMKYDDTFENKAEMVYIQAVLYNRDAVEIDRVFIPIRQSPNAQPALLPISWEFSKPWVINFSYLSAEYTNTSCIKGIVVDHVDFKQGTQSSDPAELSTKVVDQI